MKLLTNASLWVAAIALTGFESDSAVPGQAPVRDAGYVGWAARLFKLD